MGSENNTTSFRMQTLFLDPSDEHNLPKSLMQKRNFISLVLIYTDLPKLKNLRNLIEHRRSSN